MMYDVDLNGNHEIDVDIEYPTLQIGGSGTADHRELTHRDEANQHPISAITGLQDDLDSINAKIPAQATAQNQLADKAYALGVAEQAAGQALADAKTYTNAHHDSTKQDTSERQTSIPDDADNNHYPTSKAVADYVGAHGGGGAPTLLYHFEVEESATSFTQNVNIKADHYIVIFSWADPASATGTFRAYIRINNNQEWIAYNIARNATLGSVASVEVQKTGTNQIVDISCGFSRPTRNYGFQSHSQSRLYVDYMGASVNQLYLDSNLDIIGLEVDVYAIP